jgi:hypothetical protein
MSELFVQRVKIEINRFAMSDNLAQQILEVVPERIVKVRRQLNSGLPLVDDVAHLAIDRPGSVEVLEQSPVRMLDLIGLLVAQLLTQLRTVQQVRSQRPHDRALPDLHPLLDQLLAAIQRELRWRGCVVAGERGFRGGSGCGGVACDDTVSVSERDGPPRYLFAEVRGGP